MSLNATGSFLATPQCSSTIVRPKKGKIHENESSCVVKNVFFNVFPGQMGGNLGMRGTPLKEIEKIKTKVQKFQESKKFFLTGVLKNGLQSQTH